MRLALIFQVVLVLLSAIVIQAQTPSFRPLRMSPGGIILDEMSKPALLRGLNRSSAGYGTADANAKDQETANMVRISIK